MNLSDQVCSLELSKKLKKLGVKQESLFYWNMGRIFYNKDLCGKVSYSAFTSSELLELLPNKHENLYKTEQGYVFSIFGEPNTIEKNLCNALEKMLVHLIENKIINLGI